MTTLTKTAAPTYLHRDLAMAIKAGTVTDQWTGKPIPADRKLARSIAESPCVRSLRPRKPADEAETLAALERFRDTGLGVRTRSCLAYADGDATVLVFVRARLGLREIETKTFRRKEDGAWSSGRITLYWSAAVAERGWMTTYTTTGVVGWNGDDRMPEDVLDRLRGAAVEAAGVFLNHRIDTVAAVEEFYATASMDDLCREVYGCSLDGAVAEVVAKGDMTTVRLTMPPI